MKKDINIFFAITVLLIIAYFVKNAAKPKYEPIEKQISKLLQFVSPEEITDIELSVTKEKESSPDSGAGTINIKAESLKDEIKFKRFGDTWAITSFYNTRADKRKVDDLLSTLKNTEMRRVEVPKNSFRQLYLTKDSALHLTGKNKDGEILFHLLLGKKIEGSGACWIRRSDQESAFNTDKDLLKEIDYDFQIDEPSLDPKKWVEKKFITEKYEKMIAVRTEYNSKRYLWVRDDQNIKKDGVGEKNDNENGESQENNEKNVEDNKEEVKWVLVQPELKYDVKHNEVENWLKGLESIEATDVILTSELNKMDLSGAEKKVLAIQTEDVSKAEFYTFIDLGTEVYVNAKGSDVAYKVSKYSMNRAFKKLGELVDLRVLAVNKSDVIGLQFETPWKQAGFSLERDIWTIVEPDLPFEVKLTGNALEDVLNELSNLSADDIYNVQASDEIQFTHNLKVYTKTTDYVIKFIKNKEGIALTVNGTDYYVIDETKFGNLFPRMDEILKWKIIDEDISFAKEIKYSGDGLVLVFKSVKDEWLMDYSGYIFTADSNRVETLMWIVDSFVPRDIINRNHASLTASIHVVYGFARNEYVIEAGSGDGIYFVKYDGRYYQISENDFRKFRKTLSEFSRLNLYGAYKGSIKQVKLELGELAKVFDGEKVSDIEVLRFEKVHQDARRVGSITVDLTTNDRVSFEIYSVKNADFYYLRDSRADTAIVVKRDQIDLLLK